MDVTTFTTYTSDTPPMTTTSRVLQPYIRQVVRAQQTPSLQDNMSILEPK